MDNKFETDLLGGAVTETFDNGLKVMDNALETHVKIDGGVGAKITDSLGNVADTQLISKKNMPTGIIPFELSLTGKKLLSGKVALATSLPDATKTMSFTRGAS